MPKYKSSNGHHKLFWLVCTPNCALSAAGPSRISVYTTTEGCESQLSLVHAHGPDRALGLCTNPRSKESKPASKEKVVSLRAAGALSASMLYVMPLAQGGLALWPCRG